MSRQVYFEAQLHDMLAFTKTFPEKNGEINRAVRLPPDGDLESLDSQAQQENHLHLTNRHFLWVLKWSPFILRQTFVSDDGNLLSYMNQVEKSGEIHRRSICPTRQHQEEHRRIPQTAHQHVANQP